tara:strand:- start:1221 stop:2375 length:1155 start_codon:yes stop_codon:yes gene_type:complete
MNFQLSNEQAMLQNSVSRYIKDQYNFDTRRKIISSQKGMSPEVWTIFSDLGWLSIPFSEDYGGYGGCNEDVAVIMEELGRGIVVEPFVATVLLFGGLLSHCGNNIISADLIPKIIEGNCQGAFAYLERQSRFEITDMKTKATPSEKGWSIDGSKSIVLNGSNATHIIVAARTSGGQYDSSGISLFMVDADSRGISILPYRMMDGHKAANITFDGVNVSEDAILGNLDEGMRIVENIMPRVLIGLCAESVGIMSVLNDATIAYTKTRQQFGVPISSFQALQHRMVDNFMAAEQARSMVYRALCAFGDGSLEVENERMRSLHAMKIAVARSSKMIGEEAIQIHGGMGMTDELNIGHYVKRLMTINLMFGDGDYHQRKFNQISYRAA